LPDDRLPRISISLPKGEKDWTFYSAEAPSDSLDDLCETVRYAIETPEETLRTDTKRPRKKTIATGRPKVGRSRGVAAGDRFGRWTVESGEIGGRVQCRCACGTVRSVNAGNLKSGASKSCGCLRKGTA